MLIWGHGCFISCRVQTIISFIVLMNLNFVAEFSSFVGTDKVECDAKRKSHNNVSLF